MKFDTLKFDIRAAHKLSPPGLLDLAPLLVMIRVLEDLLLKHIHEATKVLKLARLLARVSKQSRKDSHFNLNLKTKTWVLQCHRRIAWVRSVIGEPAIRRWQARRRDMAVDNLSGSGSGSGFGSGRKATNPDALTRKCTKNRARNYQWKRFALVKLPDQIGKPFAIKPFNIQLKGRRANGTFSRFAPNLGGWLQPRARRIFKPVEFWPHELEQKAASHVGGTGESLWPTQAPSTQAPPQTGQAVSLPKKHQPP